MYNLSIYKQFKDVLISSDQGTELLKLELIQYYSPSDHNLKVGRVCNCNISLECHNPDCHTDIIINT